MIPGEQITTAESVVRDIEVRSFDGMTLRGRWWRRHAPRGAVIISHGFAEHGGCYRRIAEMLGDRLEFDVIAVDYRGHGKSPGRRGVVKRYDDLVNDLSSVVKWTASQLPTTPRFLVAHSNGGQVALRLVLAGTSSLEGLVVSNPAIRIAAPIDPRKLRLGRLLARVAPWMTLQGDNRTGVLTRDPVIQEEHRTDPWRHNRMSAPLFFGMVEGGELLLTRAAEIRLPLLMLLGGQDTVIDPTTSRELFDRIGSDDKTLLIYPKMLHEPFNELGKEQVYDDVVRWLEQHMPAA
jgi:alpha-beta hydrolase superfamily lysophospholipase